MPALLYGLKACSSRSSDNNSAAFAINRFLMKLFKTNNLDVDSYCHTLSCLAVFWKKEVMLLLVIWIVQ